MRLRDVIVTFQLDCGATVKVLPVDIYQRIFHDPQMKRLQQTQTTVVMFDKSELEPLGYVKVETLNPKNERMNSVSSWNTPLPQKAIHHF